jgi:hypothetical protein
MNPKMFSLTNSIATALVVLLGACGQNSGPSTTGTGGQAQGGAGGKAGQGGTATGTGGSLVGSGGKTGQGGQSTAAGGAAGGAGGKSGLGGTTEPQPDATAGAGGRGGQAGGGSQAQGDASDTSLGGTGGGSGGDDGGTATKDAATPDAVPVGHPQRVLICDEGNRRVLLVDLSATATAVWTRQLNDPTKDGDSMRDIQLIGKDSAGNDRVAVSVLKGYVELDIKTGAIKKEVSTFDGVESIRRLPNGNTILGSNSNGGVTLQELDAQDAPVPGHKVTFTNYSEFRLLRRTPQGTFLIGVGPKLAEVNWDKQTVWEMSIPDGNYVYQGLRLPDKTIAVTSGYGAAILVVDATAKKVLTTVGGKSQPDATTVVPNFYGGFQILANGHFVVANWEGHGGGNGSKGYQLLEYDSTGLLVWKWKQDATMVSSLHNVIVLDGLDTSKLHDDVNGILAPVTE